MPLPLFAALNDGILLRAVAAILTSRTGKWRIISEILSATPDILEELSHGEQPLSSRFLVMWEEENLTCLNSRDM